MYHNYMVGWGWDGQSKPLKWDEYIYDVASMLINT